MIVSAILLQLSTEQLLIVASFIHSETSCGGTSIYYLQVLFKSSQSELFQKIFVPKNYLYIQENTPGGVFFNKFTRV